MLPAIVRICVLCAFTLLSSIGATAGEVSVSVGVGGPQRFLRGHWGLVEGDFINSSDVDQEVLAVVIPADSHGTQFARRAIIPARSRRSCQWPVLTSAQHVEAFHFETLVFEDSAGVGEIQRSSGEPRARSFTVVNPAARNGLDSGYCGTLISGHEQPGVMQKLDKLVGLLRAQMSQESMQMPLKATALDGYPEALECLEQLVITSNTLHHFPEACDAVRVWTQRGGRTWICLDQTGIPSLHALLGDALPITQIDETSANIVTLEIDPSTPTTRYPQRSIVREFDEPVRHVRVIAESGDVLWTIDGWPVAIELPLGKGMVIVTTVSPEVFADLDGKLKTAVCAKQLIDRIFRGPEEIAEVQESDLSAVAAASIGYRVPSRLFAGLLMLCFVVVLAITGIRLLRIDASGALLWVIPMLGVLCAAPAVWVGQRSRAVAPPTAVQQQAATFVSGQTTLAVDGVVSVFHPEPAGLSVVMKDYSLVVPMGVKADAKVQRMIWTDRGESHWENLQQAVGVRDYRVHSLHRLSEPGKVTASFDENGLVGRFTGGDGGKPADMVFAGLSADRMSVEMTGDGTFRGTADDLLAPSEFVTGTFLSDVQRQRSTVYQSLFKSLGAKNAYPDRTTLLYWTDSVRGAIEIGNEETRQAGSMLIAREVKLVPPPLSANITIPSSLLPYRSVPDDRGGYSAAFSNTSRLWQSRESAVTSLLQFEVPNVCRPFLAKSGTLAIRIKAGSRLVRIRIGTREDPMLVQELKSPVGLFTVPLTAEHLAAIAESGTTIVWLEVDAIASQEGPSDTGQNSEWQVERISLTLNGARTE